MSTKMSIKRYSKVPIWIVEDHNEVLPYIYRAIGSRHLPLHGTILVHFDAHPDLLLPQHLVAEDVFNKEILFEQVSIESWILPTLYAGHVTTVVWIKPSWAQQIKDKNVMFTIGKHKESQQIRLTCKESYFMSDALYAPKEDLENCQEITLHVMTMQVPASDNHHSEGEMNDPKGVKSSQESNTSLNGHNNSECEHKGLLGISGMEQLYKLLEGQDYILDIDLDFFSTKNPFLDVYTAKQWSILKKLYRYITPELGSEKEFTIKRKQQLDFLEKLFLRFKEGDFKADQRNKMEVLAQELVDDIKSSQPGVVLDYEMIHQAGCTCDDTELPHHISSEEEIKQLMVAMETTLSQLPKPTLVTVARSSEDEFCPLHQVDGIQGLCISLLRTLYSELDVHMDYETLDCIGCDNTPSSSTS